MIIPVAPMKTEVFPRKESALYDAGPTWTPVIYVHSALSGHGLLGSRTPPRCLIRARRGADGARVGRLATRSGYAATPSEAPAPWPASMASEMSWRMAR